MKNNHAIKLIIFDLDGTLIDAYRAVYRSVNYALVRFGFPRVNGATVKRTVGWGETHLLKTFVGQKALRKVLPVYRRHHRAAVAKGTKFLPGARRILRRLKARGFIIAAATNRPRHSAHRIMRHLRARDYFDFVLCGDQLKHLKPHPEILQRVIKRFDCAAREALYVGDMTIDIQAGKRAGIRTVAVTTGSCPRRELAALRPFKVISRVDRLQDILEKLSSC